MKINLYLMPIMENLGNRVARLRQEKGLSQTAVAERLAIKPQSIQALEAGNVLKPRYIVDLARILGVTPEYLQSGEGVSSIIDQVPLMGKVGAGQTVIPFDQEAIDYVDAPPDATNKTVALEVDGDSMLPVYQDRYIIYYSKSIEPESAINHQCVVKLNSGEIYLKILKRGADKGLWTLQSMNSAVSDIEDVTIEWVALIDWIKPRQ